MSGYAWPIVLDPTPEEIRELRERTGAGLLEAKRALRKQKARAAFDLLRATGTFDEKIEWLLDRYEESHLAPD